MANKNGRRISAMNILLKNLNNGYKTNKKGVQTPLTPEETDRMSKEIGKLAFYVEGGKKKCK